MVESAVLLVVFNRPDTTRQVFDAIRAAKPKRLYITADGPRKNQPNDAIKTAAVRALFETIDWDCEVRTRFLEENMGCGPGVSSGINWFFEHETEGIILEDDCLPHPDFFSFCDYFLKAYRNNEQVMHIGGNSYQHQNPMQAKGVFTSRYNHIWGWATWRSAWEKFDFSMASYPDFKLKNGLSSIFDTKAEQNFWYKRFDYAFKDAPTVWDYRWTYAMWNNNGIALLPWNNLVRNIGFGADATHTGSQNHLTNYPISGFEINSSNAPIDLTVNRKADLWAFKHIFNVSLQQKIKSKIKSVFS